MSQETLEILNQIFQVCVIPLLGILTGYLIKYINAKSKQAQEKCDSEIVDRYIKLAEDLVVNAVKATNQTYVDEMKGKRAFDETAQKEAFEKTKNAVIASMGESSKDIITLVYGDVDMWLDTIIQKAVSENKYSSLADNR